MATVYRRGKIWWAQFYNANGKRVAQSTGETLKREAKKKADTMQADERRLLERDDGLQKKFAHILELASRDAGRGALTLARAEKYVKELHATANPDFVETPLRDYMRQWVKDREPQVGPSTYRVYGQNCRNLERSLPEPALSAPIGKLTDEQIRSAQAKMHAPTEPSDEKAKPGLGLKAATTNLALLMLRRVMQSAVARDLARHNHAKDVEILPTEDSTEKDPFTLAEVRLIVNKAQSLYGHDEFQGLTILAAFTGLRLMDVVSLTTDNIKGGWLTANVRKTKRGTSKKVRVPIGPAVEGWLGDRKGPLFPLLRDKTSQNLSSTFKRIMKRAGVPCKITVDGKERSRSFHSLRHFFITQLAEQDVHSDVRQKLAAHSDERIHQNYSHHDAPLVRAIATLPNL